MPLFEVLYDASLVVEVEAENYDDAREKAEPIETVAERYLEDIGDNHGLPAGVSVSTGMVVLVKNVDTGVELLV